MISLETSDGVRRRMSAQKTADTRMEMALRRALFARGLRYRVGYSVPGMSRRSIDIAFPGDRVAIFVDGCFWHRCPMHYVPVKNNSEWWEQKLERNAERDGETTDHLQGLGWSVLRIWEHEPVDQAVAHVARELEKVRGEASK